MANVVLPNLVCFVRNSSKRATKSPLLPILSLLNYTKIQENPGDIVDPPPGSPGPNPGPDFPRPPLPSPPGPDIPMPNPDIKPPPDSFPPLPNPDINPPLPDINPPPPLPNLV
ncbi:hypothetical protein M5689_005890 [Euphorbia peplus]|nr:hypothetical protein M5689_005890 [Euphorbia peplus]